MRLHVTKTQLLSYSLFTLSGVILISSVLLTMNVDVLKDWRIILPEKPIYTEEEVVLKSEYTKLRSVTGVSTRYIECENKNQIWIRYPLNEAIADRGAGNAGTGIVVKVPSTIADLPARCKFTIVIDYDVFAWRHVIETASSEEFILSVKPEDKDTSETKPAAASLSTTRTYPSPTVVPVQGQSSDSVSYSSANNTPIPAEKQRDTSQSAQPTPKPSIIERLTNPVTNLLEVIL